MKRIVIENWQDYGDYMLFARMVDKVGEWIMLESTGKLITAVGKEGSLQKYSELLKEKNIAFKFAS